MPASLPRLATGATLTAVTGVAAWVYILVAGQPFGAWGWTALTFCLLVAEVATLAIVTAVNSPHEPRLMRWRADADQLGRGAIDPLAIGFQMDLAASDLNPPRQLSGESGWLWVALVPALAALLLGAMLAA